FAPTEADLAALLSVTRPAATPDETRAAQRQKALLPRLLSATGDAGGLSAADLQAAAAALDEDPVLAEGHALWRAAQGGAQPPAAASVEHLRHIARAELGDAGGYALAVHGRTPLRLGER